MAGDDEHLVLISVVLGRHMCRNVGFVISVDDACFHCSLVHVISTSICFDGILYVVMVDTDRRVATKRETNVNHAQ